MQNLLNVYLRASYYCMSGLGGRILGYSYQLVANTLTLLVSYGYSADYVEFWVVANHARSDYPERNSEH